MKQTRIVKLALLTIFLAVFVYFVESIVRGLGYAIGAALIVVETYRSLR